MEEESKKTKTKYLYGEPYEVITVKEPITLVSSCGVKTEYIERELAVTVPDTWGYIHVRPLVENKGRSLKLLKNMSLKDGKLLVYVQYCPHINSIIEFDTYRGVKFRIDRFHITRIEGFYMTMSKVDGDRTTELEFDIIKQAKNIIITNGM